MKMENESIVGSPTLKSNWPRTAEERVRAFAESTGCFFLFWAIYLLTGSYRRSPFNAHVYLAYSLLHGRFDLINPPANFEIIHYAGRNYVAYGIAPSLLMLPFVALYGLSFHQSIFKAALAALAVTLWRATLASLEIYGVTRTLFTILFGLGSLFWFYGGAHGDTWSLMHVTAVLGLTLAIYDVVGKGRGWLAGIGFGFAVLARQPVLLSLPFFVGMLWRNDARAVNRNLNREIWFAACFAALMILEAYYNAARFGSPFDNGYKRALVGIPMQWGCLA